LIPFPYAEDNHQEKNAQVFVDKGAAVMHLEKELTSELLGVEMASLLLDTEKRQQMSDRAGELAKPDAVNNIVDQCLELIRES